MVKNKLLAFSLIAVCLFYSPVDKIAASTFWDNVGYYLYQPIAFFLPHLEKRKVIYEKQSQYFDINVQEDEAGRRHLVFLPRRGSQSVYDPLHPDQIFSNYIKYSMLAFPVLERKPKRILFLGLGGGIMPKIVRKISPDAKIDIVEIDKAMPHVAEKYFGFKKDKNINIIIGDGRVYVNRCKVKYDMIFIDVYNAYNIPFQFTTKEFYMQIKRILNRGGVCSVNVANMGKIKFVKSEIKTILSVFPNTLTFVCTNKSNYVPLIINKNKYTLSDLKRAVHNCKDKAALLKNSDNLFSACMTKADLTNFIAEPCQVFTDDYAPVNIMN